MGLIAVVNRRTVLAQAGAVAFTPLWRARAQDVAAEAPDEVAGAFLFDELADLGAERGDAVLMAAAVRALAWSLQRSPERSAVLGSAAVQDVRVAAIAQARETPGLAALAASLGAVTRDARAGAGGPQQILYLNPGARQDQTVEGFTTHPLIIDINAEPWAAAPGVTNNTALVQVQLLGGPEVVRSEFQGWARLRAAGPPLQPAYTLSVRSISKVPVRLVYCCKQGRAR